MGQLGVITGGSSLYVNATVRCSGTVKSSLSALVCCTVSSQTALTGGNEGTIMAP